MESMYLVTYGETALKGKNRPYFLKRLAGNIARRLSPFGRSRVRNTYGRIIVETAVPESRVRPVLERTFGITGFARARAVALDFDEIRRAVAEDAEKSMQRKPAPETFRISARRSNKEFPMNSTELNRRLGAEVLAAHPSLKVDLSDPDFNVHVEIREQAAYLYSTLERGPGGLPVGCSGRSVLLLSGGIDSPVAGWMMLKRGLRVFPVHFHSPPYTSVRARAKVEELARILHEWGMEPRLFVVPFTPVQLRIQETRKKELITLLVRRAMMHIAERLGTDHRIKAYITGENLGQVASQTVESMTATSFRLNRPVFRPLIGLDKSEICERAARIGTYETSILPFEDCCTLFTPEYPVTRPRLEIVQKEYEALELAPLLDTAAAETEAVLLDQPEE
jgi:thiamine biosynthesis protein ThiI